MMTDHKILLKLGKVATTPVSEAARNVLGSFSDIVESGYEVDDWRRPATVVDIMANAAS